MDTSTTITLLLIVVIGVALIFGAAYLDRSNRRKAEDKARAALQAVLDPGEPLIEFTKVNTKGGASATTALLAGPLVAGVDTAIRRASGVELYVGLTNRRLVLTPVKPVENGRSVQVIPCEEIKGIEAKMYTLQELTLTIHTQNGDMVMYVPNSQRWIRKASALENAFVSR